MIWAQAWGISMRDELGVYYYAQAGNPAVRVYVRKGENGIEFRLWQRDHPEVWETHEWLPHNVIKAAADLYRSERNADADPMKLYDIAIARNLLQGSGD